MKSKTKMLRKFICAIIAVLLINSSYAVDITTNSETAYADEKIYANATIEQDFADNRILVVLDSTIEISNDQQISDMFKSVKIQSFKNLTDINNSVYKETFQTAASASGLSYSDTPLINRDNFRHIIVLELPTNSKANVLATIKLLENIDGIVYAGPDYYTYPAATSTNDTYYNDQWGLIKSQVPAAWDITTGASNVYVGVIDSGIADHPDLSDNLITGRDFHNGNTITTDDISGHGTHVAGIIGAIGNNNTGVSGIAHTVTLVPLQVTYDDKYSNISADIEAITYAACNNIPILNYSRVINGYSLAMMQAIANYGGLFICSAGNGQRDIDPTPQYPASFKLENMISVANTTASNELLEHVDSNGNTDGSNYGATTVHLAAPGTDIISTYSDSGYAYMYGTSMAAPHVTGVAALIMSIRPDLSPTEIKALILDNVDQVSTLDGKCITGGRLNAYKAVRAATEPQTFTGDVNGDNKTDMILSRKINNKRAFTVYLGKDDGGFSEPITTQSTRMFIYSDPAFVGDFNGDGLTDVVVHWRTGGYRQLLVYISKGNGMFYEGVNLSSTREHNSVKYPCTFHVGDVNNDGKDDFIVCYRASNGYRNALVYKGTGSSPYFTDATTNALSTSTTYKSNESVYTGDFNGDGRTDMVVHGVSDGYRQLRIYTGTSGGAFNTGAILTSTRTHNPSKHPTKNFVADVNNDGKDDFIVHWKNHSYDRSNLVYKGSSTSPYLLDASTDALTSTNDYIETDPVLVGDINGDGLTDMVVQWANSSDLRQLLLYTANSDGTYNAGVNYSTVNTQNPSKYAGTFFVSDVNGDGCDDFIVKWRSEDGMVRFLTYKGTSTGTFVSAVKTAPTVNVPYYNSAYTAASAGVYKIINVGTGKCLNIYGSDVTDLYTNQNVCLWSDSGSDEQKWYVTAIGSGTYVASVIDQTYGLNAYRSGDPWNCDIHPLSQNETDAQVDFIATDGGYRIKLHNYDLYLTVSSSSNGANVYWDEYTGNSYQLWTLTAV